MQKQKFGHEPTEPVPSFRFPNIEMRGMSPDLIAGNFNDPEYPGLCFHVDRQGMSKVNSGHIAQYSKTYWGERGAGIYVLLDVSGAQQHTEYHEGKNKTNQVRLRYSTLRMLPMNDDEKMTEEIILTPDMVGAYRNAITRWVELSSLYAEDAITDDSIRRVKHPYFKEMEKKLSELERAGNDVVTNMSKMRTLSDLLLPPDALAGERNDIERLKVAQYGPLYLHEPEVFALFLENLGYDGSCYDFNENPAAVIWSLDKIDTEQGWKDRPEYSRPR